MKPESKQQINARRKEIETDLLNMLQKTKSEFDLEDIKEKIYREAGPDSLTDIIAMFDAGQGAAELQNVLDLVNDAWNYFPHQAIGGLAPVEVVARCGRGAKPKRKKSSREPSSFLANHSAAGMTEMISKFHRWLKANQGKYQEELENARYLFWASRPDLPDIEMSRETEMFFNEWRMFDFSVPGYDSVPVEEWTSFLDMFLDNGRARLSPAATAFARQARRSYAGFYQVLATRPGESVTLKDLFQENTFQAWDSNLSAKTRAGDIFYGRFCPNEEGKHIAAGSQNLPISEHIWRDLNYLIRGTHQAVVRDGRRLSLPQFLKWNSYIYYREIQDMRLEEQAG